MTPRRRKWHKPDQIPAKLRDAGVSLSGGKEVAAVLEALGISEATRVQRPFEKYQTRLLSLCGMLDIRPPLSSN